MTALVSGNVRTYPSDTALLPFLRVKLTNGKLAAAGAGDDELGVLEGRTLAGDTVGAVRALIPGEVVRMVCSDAVTQFADAYRAAGGKVSATPNGKRIGVFQEAGSADGSMVAVRILAANAQEMLVEAHTGDDTLTAAEMYGSVHTTVGAAGTVTLALPPAVVGMNAMFRVGAAQELRLDPDGTETIALPSTGIQGAAGKYLTANADGETVHIVCTKSGQWSVFGFTGTWTAEA